MNQWNRDSERIKNFFLPIEGLLQRAVVLLACLLVVFQFLVLSAVTRPYFSVVDRVEGENVQGIEIVPASQLTE